MFRIASIAAFGLLVCACASPRQEAENAIVNPLERFPMTAQETADETRLAVHASGVSANQQAALVEVAARWRDSGGRLLVLKAPQGGGGAAFVMAEQTRAILVGEGVSPAAIRIEGYDAAGDASAPIVVAFSRYEANVPRCGQQWDNLSGTQSNNNHSNFGCAISANMAAQIANPADLVAPPPMTPGDAGRRAVVMEAYRKGEVTASRSDANQSGVVSQAVK